MVTTRKSLARDTSVSHHRPPPEPESSVNKFFRLVLPSTMKKNMMMIPPRFVRLHGSKLSEIVTLETPVGFKRSVNLKRIGGELWFQEGWSEFAEAHSFSEGHFLLFEYKGNSSFRVIIFDVTACEIKYPLDAVNISDSDDDIIDVTDQMFLGNQGTRETANSVNGDLHYENSKRPRDTAFENILNDVDAINSFEVLKEEQDTRVFRGNQS